jgi:hypothetical protein
MVEEETSGGYRWRKRLAVGTAGVCTGVWPGGGDRWEEGGGTVGIVGSEGWGTECKRWDRWYDNRWRPLPKMMVW